MTLLIDAQGRVAESRIIKSSRSFSLDRASRDAIALCRFVPPMQNRVAVGGWVSLKHTWSLRETMGVFRDGPDDTVRRLKQGVAILPTTTSQRSDHVTRTGTG
ncbi:TonB family protein [Rugamonas aquatica]|uniref:TonB family protein n=1 Tax=Rugamonas aquatica TaxID=2743357 RepID=A0A6A7N9J1_9BURK|nr:TonB family protein [Rugamonas aquatica]MQA41755.1 TonB family protein [Rugamonas aquatica]